MRPKSLRLVFDILKEIVGSIPAIYLNFFFFFSTERFFVYVSYLPS